MAAAPWTLEAEEVTENVLSTVCRGVSHLSWTPSDLLIICGEATLVHWFSRHYPWGGWGVLPATSPGLSARRIGSWDSLAGSS